jgi:UDP-4-amino-4,6-dideoxy-L-N-acetyl-beta-L-altrosamine transaminase
MNENHHMQPKNPSFLPYAIQSINKEDIDAVASSLTQEAITRGPFVHQFEEKLAEYVEAPYAVVFNSGSSALEAAYYALSTSKEDKIFTTPNSYIATISTGMKYGALPYFCDLDRESGNLSIPSLLSLLNTPQSRGKKIIVPVHFAGVALDMKKISDSIKDPSARIIEDGAHALGSRYPSGEKVGSCLYSDLTIFSFHPAKIITSGEGGAVTTRSEELYQRLLLFRNNGIQKNPPSIWSYDALSATGNFHMNELQAALGLSQLSTIEDKIEKRRSLMAEYYRLSKNMTCCRIMNEEAQARTAWHLCLAKIPFKEKGLDRDAFMNALWEKGIGTQLHYIPLYRHSFVKNSVGEMTCDEMENYFQEALSLPLHTSMELEDVARVLEAVESIL